MDSRTQNPRNTTAPIGMAGYDALKNGVAIVEHEKAILRLTGKDPFGMLNAILTSQVPEEPGLGAYALLLNPKGRIQTDLRVLKDPSGEDVFIVAEPEGAGAAREILGRYAPFSRVKLEDVSDPWGILGLYGPDAGELAGNVRPREHETVAVRIGGTKLVAVGVTVPVPGFDLLGPVEALQTAREHLVESGAVLVDGDVYETARIEAGVPRFGADMTAENFPGEAGVLDRAVSFEKGCYPGQETVARMRYRGHPNRTLHRLAIVDAGASPGAEISQGDKTVGWISSVAPLPVDGKTLALGYLSRKADTRASMRAGAAEILILGSA